MAGHMRPSSASSLATEPSMTSQPNTRQPPSRGDVTIVTALVAVGIAMPAAISAWLGAFDIPRNDSWSYRRVLWEFVGTGHVRLVGWSGMTMIGQVFWTAPFVEVLGKGQWVPGTAVAVASAIGLACAYALARSLLPRAWAAGCVLLTLAVPGVLLNTSSFMTDVTAFSAEVACLLFGAAALHRSGRGRWALVAAAVVTGCFGFSIREFDLAAPAAVLIVLAVQDRRAWRAYGPWVCARWWFVVRSTFGQRSCRELTSSRSACPPGHRFASSSRRISPSALSSLPFYPRH